MMTWSKGVAVLALGLILGAVSNACAQSQAPTPIGPARIVEPVPCAPSPPLAPGPIAPLDAPPGPDASYSLPVNHSSAFQLEDYPPEQGIYTSIGAMALQRQGLGTLTLGNVSDTVLDTGALAPAGSPPAQDLSQLTPHMAFGVRATVGYIFNDNQVEVTGFTVPDNARTLDTVNQGKINLPFFNVPLGFEGDNNIFRQADEVRTTLTSRIWNLELNYRYNDVAFIGCELFIGLRYLQQHDVLNIFDNDDGLTNVDIFGNPDKTRQAVYQVAATNNFIAPQLGFEYQHNLFKYLSFGMTAKGAWGPNLASVETSLVRGDGLVGYDQTKNDVIFSHMYELNFFLEFHLLERMRVRAGYDLMWLCQWATAPSNLNFNLAAPLNPNYDFNRNGSIFYMGPTVELELLF